jgi:hypothetical protein
MDQPGNSHYAVHMSQQTLNGHGGYYGQGYEANGYEANGYEANGYEGNSYEANGHNGSARNGYGGTPADYHAGAGLPGTAAEADIDIGADEIVQDLTVPNSEDTPSAIQDDAVLAGTLADTELTDTVHADEGLATARADGGESVDDVAPEVLDGQDAAGTVDGTAEGGAPTAGRGSASSSAADRMRELLARSTADHAATERATAATLDDIRQQLADLEHAVAQIRERAATERDVADWLTEQFAPQTQRLAGMSATLDGLTAGMSTFGAQLASTEGRVTALDTRFERLDERLDDQYDRVSSIDGRVSSIDAQVATADGRIVELGGQFTDAIAPLADELRARPSRTEVEEVVTKIVDVAHNDLSTRLASLEDTVLTLAEALLRPAPGHAPDAL